MRLQSRQVLAALLALPGALPARAQGAGITLVNRTRQTWQVRADPTPPPRVRVWLTVTPPGGTPGTALDVPGTAAASVELAPGAALAIAHGEPPGGDVRRFLEFRTEPGPDHPGPWPVEGCLCLRTVPRWLFWGPDRTSLEGLFYADGTPARFRFTPQADGSVHLERAPDPATGCLISRRPSTGFWPRPCRSPWAEPAPPPGAPGAAG